MTGDDNAVGHADYGLQAGPGIVRARMAGSVTVPSGLFYPFNPSAQAVSTTELTVSGPDGELNTSVNVHVDGFLDIPVCGSGTICGGLEVAIVGRAVHPAGGVQHARRHAGQQPRTRLRPGPGRVPRARGRDRDGVRLADEHSDPDHDRPQRERPVRRQPGPVDVRRQLRRPRPELQVSFDPAKPVLNDIPAGYTVSGPNVVDNHWTDPFAPPSGDVVVTSCAQLAQLTHVTGNLVIRNLPGCPTISLPNLTRVDGDLIIEGNDASSIDVGSRFVSVGGDLTHRRQRGDRGRHRVCGRRRRRVSGDLDISQNAGSAVINVGNGQIGGDCTIVDNGDAVVDVGGASAAT